jgi:EAL domain-containing protein (putative c-di-GMP-specific phosphodiesterase class I)/GGDEF domain-containing protein
LTRALSVRAFVLILTCLAPQLILLMLWCVSSARHRLAAEPILGTAWVVEFLACMALMIWALRARELRPSAGDAGESVAATDRAVDIAPPQDASSSRAAFLQMLADDITAKNEPAVLALIRMSAHERLAGFNPDIAEHALAQFRALLAAAVRRTARVGQVDHDSFAIWFPATDVEAAVGELRAIGYVLNQDIAVDGQRFAPEARIGCAAYPLDADEPGALLACGLAALRTGTSESVSLFTASAGEQAHRAFLMQQGVRDAIQSRQFALQYQPIVDASGGRVIGAEALLRWMHPELGPISPSEFIPVLEESGFIDDIGNWALEAACRQLREWRQASLPKLRMAVNISARQFRNPSLALTVVRTLERHKLVPADLEIEVTETAAMSDAAMTRGTLEQLHALGVGVAIDDFGAGFSSLSYLKNLPFSKLKIDREFVCDVHQRSDSRAICVALVALADGLGIDIVAEGVERREEAEALVRIGCSTFQGYLFSPPVAAAQFAAMATDPKWLQSLRVRTPARVAERMIA